VTVRILQGDALTRLRAMPAESAVLTKVAAE